MQQQTDNPFLRLTYEPALESLGDDYFDVVAAAEFPAHTLRWRNDDLLPQLGLDPAQVSEHDFTEAFGAFWGRSPFLALRYHGYQFGDYNSRLGDGRGFLYGQVRGVDGELYDLGTKGSGMTPYSRGGDGRLTLKGGVREILASEALQAQGVLTSRCLSLVETGEQLYRGDEPSPTRASVMVRWNRSHIRFGTFERLHYHSRADLIQTLLDHVLQTYYPHLLQQAEAGSAAVGLLFYAELVERVADLTAQWMAAGFCHAVLNTDNMSITGESFDYGPFAFIETYDPKFVAAYFDYYGRYRYANQPGIGQLNLQMLQTPLSMVLPKAELDRILEAAYETRHRATYRRLMLQRLGFNGANAASLDPALADDLLRWTIQLLNDFPVGYPDFFRRLRQQYSPQWREEAGAIPPGLFELMADSDETKAAATRAEAERATETNLSIEGWESWRDIYHLCLNQCAQPDEVAATLAAHNPITSLVRSQIEAIWEPIAQEDNWQPFYDLVDKLQRLN